jgi:putative NADH-flavin reductase
VTALVRPYSLQKLAVRDLEKKAINIVGADLSDSKNEAVKVLNGHEVVTSTIYGPHVLGETRLINISKAAGVRRYLVCFFATVFL